MDSYLFLSLAALLFVLSVAGWLLLSRRTTSVGQATTSRLTVEPEGAPAYGLARTRAGLWGRLKASFGSRSSIAGLGAEFEEILLAADVGAAATAALLSKLRTGVKDGASLEEVREVLKQEMLALLPAAQKRGPVGKPHVILVAGVNGVGKTTTIGKLANRYRTAGSKVLLVACDTFRAAAAEQLAVWAERVGVECVRHKSGADPSAVAFDGMAAALARGADVVIVDTAGRLHVKQHLVEELRKVVRTIGRQINGAPHEVLLVVDATTGQNAIAQVRVFLEAVNVSGIVLTKLDGTARGGVVFAIQAELGVPVQYVGFGEKMGDLQAFHPELFVDGLLG